MQYDQIADAVVEDWWKPLHSDHGDRGAKARLKRCKSVLDALLEPETHKLIAKVHGKGYASETNLAVLALTLARVKPAEQPTRFPKFATVLGHTRDNKIPKDNDPPRLSPMRFSALLRAGADKDKDRFAQALRRALAILGDTPFDMRRFVLDILFFNDQTQRNTQRNWTFEYYHTPHASNTQSREETQL
ncbi:MAG: type I-E CRISPR-associated protein Cse2/CasB [Gemmatimonadota bacterium]|nr:type I-E CRISPR-associated protein Cse2/CasB [Gemmatimonadota bacterium]